MVKENKMQEPLQINIKKVIINGDKWVSEFISHHKKMLKMHDI